MKAILEFDLPDDMIEFQTASNAGELVSAINDYINYLRGKTKYAPEDQKEDITNAYEDAYTNFWEIMNAHEITNILQ